jgi:hypothetical protein
MTIAELFGAAGLSPAGQVLWGTPCDERTAGVYAIAIDGDVVYVGPARRSLRQRRSQFYRHRFSERRPHRGGQDVLTLPGERVVFWCVTRDPADAEARMLAAFERRHGRLPTANKKRDDRKRRIADSDH